MTTASQHFGIDPWRLRQLGAYDVPIDGEEAPVYLDPRLLRQTRVPEFQDAMDRVGRHFAEIFALLRAAKTVPAPTATAYRERAEDILRFAELEGLRIGVGKGAGTGKGIGPARAKKLYDLAEEFVQDDFSDPILFEMFALVKAGVGADLVSDMLADISRDSLYKYSERVARELRLPTEPFNDGKREYQLAWNTIRKEHILFPPADALAEIPGFRASKRFDRFQFSHDGIRKAISDWLKEFGAIDPRRFLLEHRELAAEITKAYTATKPRTPDPFAVKGGARLAGLDIAEDLKPELARVAVPRTAGELVAVVADAVTRFKAYVDAGRARTHLHGKSKRDEKFVQHMFAAFVATFCEDRKIRCTREADDGMGPVDFLFTIGERIAVVLELKLSSNTGLLRTFGAQAQAYQTASAAQAAFFVVIDLTDEHTRLEQLVKKHDELGPVAHRPRLFIIDGRDSPSASKIAKPREPLPQPGDWNAKRLPNAKGSRFVPPQGAPPAASKPVAGPTRGSPAASTPVTATPQSSPPHKSGIDILADLLDRWSQSLEERSPKRPPRKDGA